MAYAVPAMSANYTAKDDTVGGILPATWMNIDHHNKSYFKIILTDLSTNQQGDEIHIWNGDMGFMQTKYIILQKGLV